MGGERSTGIALHAHGLVESLRVEFPAACGVSFVGERIYPQESQRNGADVPLGISGEVPTSSVRREG